ncbi:MAG TPA: hotdog fold thioesterase [Bacteroidales bacterium]|nr:hotdog fold thioesterase [Bacteroidales bacterium]
MKEKVTDFASLDIQSLNALNKGTLMEQLGIEYLELAEGYIKARMPVDERTSQPSRRLHGGASFALAETVGGIGSALLVDLEKYEVRGAQMSGNHLRSVREGWVFAEAKLLHRGRNTHIWNIDILDMQGKMVSTYRLTNFIISK